MFTIIPTEYAKFLYYTCLPFVFQMSLQSMWKYKISSKSHNNVHLLHPSHTSTTQVYCMYTKFGIRKFGIRNHVTICPTQWSGHNQMTYIVDISTYASGDAVSIYSIIWSLKYTYKSPD